jgi:uncharacterized protein with HEPN domain
MPRPLDLIVEEMLDYIEQARSFTADITFEQYRSDRRTQRAVERCIEIISEASRHLPDNIKQEYTEIPWDDVAGIGNVFRHEYHNIAVKIVWDTVKVHLGPLETVMRAIAAELPTDGDDDLAPT